MIYVIQAKQDLIVETDSLEFVKKTVRDHPDCSIRELGSGKVYRPRLVPAAPRAPGELDRRTA
jgi:hypothetical protein